MSASSSIEWTDTTWNPVRGCSIVSPGCVNCYAMKQAHRFSGEGKPYHGLTKQTERSGPQWTGVVRAVDDALLEPPSWRRPRRVFVNSMSDLFHEGVPDDFIIRVLEVIERCPQHTFQVLTKRARRMRDFFVGTSGAGAEAPVLRNLWLGVSVEDQKHADERIPLLLQTPAAVRFISAEPLLGGLNIEPWLRAENCNHPNEFCEDVDCRGETWLDWVIVGGESGPGSRPFDIAWARSIVQQCKAAGVACFVKQLGAKPEARLYCTEGGARCDPPHGREQYAASPLELVDRKGGDPSEWDEDLRVREFPEVAHA